MQPESSQPQPTLSGALPEPTASGQATNPIPEHPLEFFVANAERMFSQGGEVKHLSFWAYKILCRSYLPSYQNPPVYPIIDMTSPPNFKVMPGFVDYCAWRRYSDMEWLREQLFESFPGIVWPPIPKKSNEGTKDKIFDLFKSADAKETASNTPIVAERIRQFQLFFNHLSLIPETAACEHVRAFVCMQEEPWMKHRAEVDAAKKQKFSVSVMSKLGGFWERLTETRHPVFDDVSPLGILRRQQQDMSQRLRISTNLIETVLAVTFPALDPPKETAPRELAAEDARRQSLCTPLIFNGHLVCDPDHPNTPGVVRHVDELCTMAWVDWGDGKIVKVPTNTLTYTRDHIVDPAMCAMNEFTNQLDAFFIYASRRKGVDAVIKLRDLMWFWSAYSEAVAEVISKMEHVEQDRIIAHDQAQKAKGEKRREHEDKAGALSGTFAQMMSTFSAKYPIYVRQHQVRALHQMGKTFGASTLGLLDDDDWARRMAACDAALPLHFGVPEEVQRERDRAVAAAAAAVSTTPGYVDPVKPSSKNPDPSSYMSVRTAPSQQASGSQRSDPFAPEMESVPPPVPPSSASDGQPSRDSTAPQNAQQTSISSTTPANPLRERGDTAVKPKAYFGFTIEEKRAPGASDSGVLPFLVVSSIDVNSPAYEAGVQLGDILVTVEGCPVPTRRDMHVVIAANCRVGFPARFGFTRGFNNEYIELQLMVKTSDSRFKDTAFFFNPEIVGREGSPESGPPPLPPHEA